MNVKTCVSCIDFPCQDVKHSSYIVPDIEMDPKKIFILMISEAAPQELGDYYYSGPQALFAQTTLQVFEEAGVKANSIQDLLGMGIYLTTAVKCGKTAYAIETSTLESCSHLLERELALFPNVQAYLLMGDVAIKTFNLMAKRLGRGRVIPSGPTYKIRRGSYLYQGKRVFPSYLQAGPSFFIEKGKHKVMAEDITAALNLL
jgi:uracil-DNA glycosylase